MERLRAGEVVVTESAADESGGTVRAQVLVEAPARMVWDVISSCAQAMRYIRGMEDCEVLVDEPGRALTHHVVDPGWLVPDMDYRFETRRDPYRRMDFELTDGNLRRMEGYWSIEPAETGVLVEHEMRIRPKTPAPRWLVLRKLRQDLPGMMSCIKGLAEGSAGKPGVRDDLAACQPSADGPNR